MPPRRGHPARVGERDSALDLLDQGALHELFFGEGARACNVYKAVQPTGAPPKEGG